MAEVVHSDTGSPDTDKDFDLTADMMVHDYDDERTLDEEEALTGSDTGELDDLQKESEMPIEDLLAQYTTGAGAVELTGDLTSDSSSSSEDEDVESQEPIANKIATHDKQNNNGSLPSEPTKIVSRSQTERLLRSTSHHESDDSESSSEDENYEPIEEHKKTIQVGSDFQAVIPVGLSVYGDAPAYENEDRLLWDPSKIKDENALNEYLCNIQREVDKKLHTVSNIPRGQHIRDDEQALFLLLQCDNNIEEAERRRKMQAVPPTDVMSLWSEDECRNFEDGLRLYGKNFHEIHHNKVRTRSVYELVHFYYLWKKTERHDIFAAKTRAEKRKYALSSGAIDHMDRFLEEQEVELHQLTSPQTSETKLETNEDEHAKSNIGIFNTGKTTILSPSRHADKTLGASKRSHHNHHEINGSSFTDLTEHSSPKRLKIDILSSEHHTPKKQKLHENLQESSRTVEINSSSSLPTLPFNSVPVRSPSKSADSPEHGSEPKHITGDAAASVVGGGLPNPDNNSSSTNVGHSASTDTSLNREVSETSGSFKYGNVVSGVSSKSLAEGGDKHTSYITNNVMSLWSEDECRNFEDGLRLYGKNFHEIHHNKVRTRSVYELVHFYYLWKKTERHDIFAAKTRAEKRKYALSSGAIDHMDRFLEEQEVELHQLTSPQTSETKLETNEDEHAKSNIGIFNTGKTTILSPSRHADKTLGASKRSHHNHHEINGSSFTDLTEHSSPKRLKIDILSSEHHTPKKQKLHENLQESSRTVEINSSSSLPTLPFNSVPVRSPSKSADSPEHGSEPKHITGDAAASVVGGGLPNPDNNSSSTNVGHSASTDTSLNREVSETSGSFKYGNVVSGVSSKSLAEGGDKHTSYITNNVMSLWSEDECRNFEDGLRLYGKNFHEIHHNKVRTRSVYELVHFYYLWKKTERHDIFAAKTRAEKRKYALNSGAIDHMDRFLEEQEVELHQLTSPQTSETKLETNEDEHAKSNIGIFNTGKTTILSPSRHADKTLGASKRSHHNHHEINGSSFTDLTEHSSPKRLKIDILSSEHHTPKKHKLHENLQESSRTVEINSSSSLPTLPFNSVPVRSPSKSADSPEHGSEPKHITGDAAASVVGGGLPNPDNNSSSTNVGHSASTDTSLNREVSETSGSFKYGNVVSGVSSKSLAEGGDKHTSYITNSI